MIIITDILRNPIDEGAKVATYELLKRIRGEYGGTIVSVNGDRNFSIVDRHFDTNKLLFKHDLYRYLKELPSQNLLYIPEASITLNSFLRAKLLNWFTGKKVHILSFQPRQYGRLTQSILPRIKPESVITQSASTAQYLDEFGFRTNSLSLGVDEAKFQPYDEQLKEKLRRKYLIPLDVTVLLHVGHVRSTRNLDVLMEVKRQLPEVYPIIIGSTYSPFDDKLYAELVAAGIKVIRQYIPKLEDFYNMADYYIFPVMKNDGAIETPLSVLEAMACNIPILTTSFGSLNDVFTEDRFFHFFARAEEVVDIIKFGKMVDCNNRVKLTPFTWDAITAQLVDMVNN